MNKTDHCLFGNQKRGERNTPRIVKESRCFDQWKFKSDIPRVEWSVLPGGKRKQKTLNLTIVLTDGAELSGLTGEAGKDTFLPLFD